MGEPFPNPMSVETQRKLSKRQGREIKELQSVWDAIGDKKVRETQKKVSKRRDQKTKGFQSVSDAKPCDDKKVRMTRKKLSGRQKSRG